VTEEARERTRLSITKRLITLLSTKSLHRVMKEARRELAARHVARLALKEQLSGGFSAMANFMAGVTWAMACRAALRESKEHPPIGKKPAAGHMWLPWELLYAVRHQVKDRGWHPITSKSWSVVRDELAAEARHAAVRRKAELNAMPGQLAHFHAQTFRIPFARQEVRMLMDLDDQFDKSGAV
jgi:hypothetical protein